MKSRCCNAKVFIAGAHSTHYYVCSKCGKPCDVRTEE